MPCAAITVPWILQYLPERAVIVNFALAGISSPAAKGFFKFRVVDVGVGAFTCRETVTTFPWTVTAAFPGIGITNAEKDSVVPSEPAAPELKSTVCKAPVMVIVASAGIATVVAEAVLRVVASLAALVPASRATPVAPSSRILLQSLSWSSGNESPYGDVQEGFA